MTDKRIELLCEIMIKGTSLTKQTLLINGFKELELNKMLEEGILVPTRFNEYKLYSMYELFYYGLNLLSKKEIKKANICFEICYQLEPNNRDFILQLFLKSLKIKDYKSAIKKFSIMEKIEPAKNRANNNLYLYLLNIITPHIGSYRERISDMDYDSIFPQDNSDEKTIDNIRHLVMKYKYRKALEALNRVIYKDQIKNIELEVLKELLEQVIETEKSSNLSLLAFAEDKRYQAIVSTLKEKSKKIYLSNDETYIYLIAKRLINVLDTGVIPEIKITDTKCLYEAIKGNNYQLAEELNTKFIKRSNKSLETQILDILLKNLNRLISKLQIEQATQNTQNIPNQDYIKEIEEIAYYLQAENIPLEKAIKEQGLMLEQVLLIKLIYARDYYTEEMYLLGDTLLKEVEKNKNKTSRVVKLLNEIRTNKKFYKNRRTQHTRRLTLQ